MDTIKLDKAADISKAKDSIETELNTMRSAVVDNTTIDTQSGVLAASKDKLRLCMAEMEYAGVFLPVYRL